MKNVTKVMNKVGQVIKNAEENRQLTVGLNFKI